MIFKLIYCFSRVKYYFIFVIKEKHIFLSIVSANYSVFVKAKQSVGGMITDFHTNRILF